MRCSSYCTFQLLLFLFLLLLLNTLESAVMVVVIGTSSKPKDAGTCKRKNPSDWQLEFRKPCQCAASRADTAESCLSYFVEEGIHAYRAWRDAWEQLHKLDQDRADTLIFLDLVLFCCMFECS